MFFTRIGKVLAHFIFRVALIQLALGYLGAFGTPDMESNRAFANRYLGAATTGAAITKAQYSLLVGLVLGILCEISANRAKATRQD